MWADGDVMNSASTFGKLTTSKRQAVDHFHATHRPFSPAGPFISPCRRIAGMLLRRGSLDHLFKRFRFRHSQFAPGE
jgi:hypothetical protein